MKIDKSELGRAIKHVRIASGMTQRELSEKSGLSINYLSLLENGRRGIGLDKLNDLAEIWGIPAWLFAVLGAEVRGKTHDDATRLLEQIKLIAGQAVRLYISRHNRAWGNDRG